MKKIILGLFGLLMMVCITSCSKDDLPDFNEITGPRIIGLVADKPEANPGDTINITPIISDLQATTTVQDSIQVCIDLGISHGANPTCEGNPTKMVVQNHRTLTLPGAADNWTGLADGASFSIPNDTVIFDQRSDQEKYNGVNYLVEYTLHSSSGQNLTAIKRIVVTEATKLTKNQNPTFNDVLADGISMTNLPIGAKVSLTNNLTNASAENYSLKDKQGNLKNYAEELTVTWFITDGETKYYRSAVGTANVYTGPSSAPVGRAAYILVLARDDRGGLVVVSRKLN